MAIKQDEQPTFLNGQVVETAVNTLTTLEIQVPRLLADRQLFDIDEIVIGIDAPLPTLGADAAARGEAQLIISENTPTALLNKNDPRILAFTERISLANATDRLFTGQHQGFPLWKTETHANLVPDDKVWLIVQGTGNRAASVRTAFCRIKGKMAKVSVADFEALVLSRLGQ